MARMIRNEPHPVLLCALFVLLHTTAVLAAAVPPADYILLNCGSSEEAVDADGRKWSGDNGNKVRISTGNSSPVKAGFQDPSIPSQVPYMTARVFMSESSTYKFSVSGKTRHYLRLHFYPTSYNNLLPEDAFFGVSIAGGVTLLRNFSAYITSQALTQAYLVKEFSLPPSTDGTVTITFTPTPEHKNSYAFINGIEVISMPNEIYGSPATMVGFDDQTIEIGPSTTVQTMYRLNVGGQYVAPTNDSAGLSRTWYDDSPYIYGAGFGVTFSAEKNVTVRYADDQSDYSAPVDVYRTARSMGPDPKININYNLTWMFQVDVNYTYLVRFHFCELLMEKINQRVFDIYINNQTAQAGADVIGWTSEMAVPTYKDYAIYVQKDGRGNDGDEELWVALHPSDVSKPEYLDAILNGLEVFKLNDTTANLFGANPVLSPMRVEAESMDVPKFVGSKTTGVNAIGAAAGGVAALGLVFAICVAVYHKKLKKVDTSMSSGNSGWLPLYNSHTTSGSKSTISGKSTTSSHLSTLAASLCRHFSFSEIKSATKNFDESLVIGVGGFGKVYKGVIDGGTIKVAIKRSNPSSEQGVNEFLTEIEMLSKLRHRHLVSLIGYCEEKGEMILVYDYMAHGTLREHLYNSKSRPSSLSWKQRLEISIGSARGLHYLHTGAKYTIIHRDVKTTNILLDEKWVAKVSDFGLSKTGPTTVNQNHVSTMVKGSFGYLDPEYFRRQQLTEKSDVYSFGVVLFEVLCGRPALNPSLPKEQVSLADWALLCHKKDTLHDIIDPQIRDTINPECLAKFADTAQKCLLDHGADRPSMGDVLWNLEFALQLQDCSEQQQQIMAAAAPGGHDDHDRSTTEASKNGTHNLSDLNGGELSDESSSTTADVVFSQLINPKGR